MYALAPALTDAQLFAVCLRKGDARGALKFFVSTRPDRPSDHSNVPNGLLALAR